MTRARHTLSTALSRLAALLLVGAAGAVFVPASASAAIEGIETYVGCGLTKDTQPSHACDLDHGNHFGAFFRSPVATGYEVCVEFPGGARLCAEEQHADAGQLYVNKVTTNLGGPHDVVWIVEGEEVGSWSFKLPVQPPVFGKIAGVRAASGKVLIKSPKSNAFVPLTGAMNVPMGTVLDTRAGVVELETASGEGKVQSGIFSAGVFSLGQERSRSPFAGNARTGLTVLTLTGPLPKCGSAAASGSGRGSGKGRRLWGDAHGDYQTGGRYASATVGGTRWLTEDSCAGTRVKVARGVVGVSDHRSHRDVIVTAGHSYLARSSGRPQQQRGVPVLGKGASYTKGYGHPHPRELSSGPTAVTFRVTDITWERWGAKRAVGTGTGWYVPKGKAILDGHEDTLRIIAFDLGSCDGRFAYRKLSWFFPSHGGHFDPGAANKLCL